SRPSKCITPGAAPPKPAIRAGLGALPRAEPPARETNPPQPLPNLSPAPAVDAPKRLVRPATLIRTSARELFQPALDEPVLVGRIACLHEVEGDQAHVQDLLPAHGDVRPSDPRAAPRGARGHRRLGHP